MNEEQKQENIARLKKYFGEPLKDSEKFDFKGFKSRPRKKEFQFF